jgi:GNAT superfamily N-acetyltransferase
MDQVEILTLTTENKSEFVDKLKQALIQRFGEEIPENYGSEHPWSLLNLVQNDTLDMYQLLFKNGKFLSGSGGMIRELDGEKVYQACFRLFSHHEYRHHGLGGMPLSHTIMTKNQIERAKTLQCDSVVLSFNDYNYKFFQLNLRYFLRKGLPEYKFVASTSPVMFNGVEQWLLTLKL